MNPLTPEQAAAALADVEQARLAMRRAIRDHRGHYHLWIWGGTWVAMPLTAHFGGDHAARYFLWICAVGAVLSIITGFAQGRSVRRPTDLRFVGMFFALFIFGAIFPTVLRVNPEPRAAYAYGCLIAMQTYVIAGLWADTYLLWTGIIVAALVLAGVFLFPGIFWLWMAIFGGGSLLLTGFYVRHFWR